MLAEKQPERRLVPAAPSAWLSAWRLVRALLLVYLGLLLIMMWFEESLIFIPSKYPVGDWQPHGLDFEDAWFETHDGVKLHGWYVEHPSPRAVILFSHGNAGNVTHRAGIMEMLTRVAQASVLVYDYRGYGRSEGRPNERGVYADARAARAWLAQRVGVQPGRIVLMGESLGAAVAVELAAADGCRALVLESAFTSAPDMAAVHYPFVPARLLMRNRFDSIAKIGKYQGPLFQGHGTADTIVPFDQGKRLFEAAKSAEPKQFLAMEGRDHNDPPPWSYYETLGDFLHRIP